MFSLAPNTQTSRFALCLWQPDYSIVVFFASIFCFEFATHHTRAWLPYGYLANIQYSNKVLSGYFHLSQLSCPQSLRGRLKGVKGQLLCQPLHHQADHGKVNERLRGLWQ